VGLLRALFFYGFISNLLLADFMRASPFFGRDDIEFERNRGLPREIEF
jgi:hypothetical protein